jgi:glycosyltransferase involved in cell wall biosynthesis
MDDRPIPEATVASDARGREAETCVTVLMPMRNAGTFLAAAIDSVLGQDATLLELLVIDDGSTDGSREYVQRLADPRVRLIDGPRNGISACLNCGLEQARGTILMRCDSDDLFPPGRIGRQVAFMASHPGFVAVCGPFSMVDPKDRPVASPAIAPAAGSQDVASQILSGGLRTHLCTFAFRRGGLQRAGVFRSFFQTAEDIDFQLRLAAAGPIAFLPEISYVYRLHDASITHTQASTLRRFFESTAYEMAADRIATGSDALTRGETVQLPVVEAKADRADKASLHIAQMLVGEAWERMSRGDHAAARLAAWDAVKARPVSFDAWKALLLICARTARRSP